MKKTLFPLLLIILLPGCLNFKQRKSTRPNKKISVVNQQNKIDNEDIDFILEDDLTEGDPFLIKNNSQNNLEAAEEIAWEKSTDYELEQRGRTIHFDYDKSNLKPEEEKNLRDNVSLIKQRMSKNPELTVLVEGHSCLFCKNQEYNHMISQQRANKVAKAYADRGIPTENIKAVGRGTTETLSSIMQEEDQSPNRRAETTILDL